MRHKLPVLLATVLSLLTPALLTLGAAQDAPRDQPSAKSQERIIKEVRHELLMLPYVGVFDYIAYKVEGYNVTLLGQVVKPVTKSDAENAVKHIEGVEKVDDQIEVLPPSPLDDGIRRRLFRAIYGYPALERYALGAQKPIRIIVKNGRVTLEGVVDTDGDKNIAGIRANGVSERLLGDQQSASCRSRRLTQGRTHSSGPVHQQAISPGESVRGYVFSAAEPLLNRYFRLFPKSAPAYNAPGFDFDPNEPSEERHHELQAMNRRTFLETATTVTAATLLTSRLGWAAGDHKIDKVGLQLYTVRDLMKTDFDGTIAKVAQIGYKEVEFAGYFGRTGAAGARRRATRTVSMPVSTHVQYDELDDKFPSVIETSKAIGLKYIVCPWIPEELRKSPDIWKQAAEKFNRCGEPSKKAGMQFAYHNHWFEFLPVDGKLPYDLLLTKCDANLVKMEMDLCWITAAGGDPVKYFNEYPGRFPLVHVKDLKTMPHITAGGAQNYGDTVDLTEVGSGLIDWKKFLASRRKPGSSTTLSSTIIPKQPFDSITKSYEYLRYAAFLAERFQISFDVSTVKSRPSRRRAI